MKHLASIVTAILLGLATSFAFAAVMLDPADFPAGSNVSVAFADVRLSGVSATADVVAVDVFSPLREVPGIPTPIYAFDSTFSDDPTRPRTWFAGAAGIALRIDFDTNAEQISVLFIPDDTDTGLLSVFGPSDEVLGDLVARSFVPFTLTFAASGTPIAYALASYGDTGYIGRIQYEPARQVPEPATPALVGLGLAGLGFSRRSNRSHAIKGPAPADLMSKGTGGTSPMNWGISAPELATTAMIFREIAPSSYRSVGRFLPHMQASVPLRFPARSPHISR